MSKNSKVVSKKKQGSTLLYVKQHWQLYVIFLLPALALTCLLYTSQYIYPLKGVLASVES